MPIFSSTSHVQITGGNFVDIGGDFNLESIQPPGSVDIDGVLTGLEFGVGEDSGRPLLDAEQSERVGCPRMLPYHSGQGSVRQLVGAERTERVGGPRMLPYDLSHRRQNVTQSNNSYSTQHPQLEASSDDPTSSNESPAKPACIFYIAP
ncbi:hypothetical protein MVEN_01862500 [Mycena venus]|uniref:Uncharacterized protein n=1 Tax=Mycena venus TaxID=2733690 RepID=A0A8H6XGV8_9AGAR|nr:hypothetical protein MVEN_01862500 [Mycena venus]